MPLLLIHKALIFQMQIYEKFIISNQLHLDFSKIQRGFIDILLCLSGN